MCYLLKKRCKGRHFILNDKLLWGFILRDTTFRASETEQTKTEIPSNIKSYFSTLLPCQENICRHPMTTAVGKSSKRGVARRTRRKKTEKAPSNERAFSMNPVTHPWHRRMVNKKTI